MATDERGVDGGWRAGETMWSGPYLQPGERVTVVPKARAQAAEQRARELGAECDRLKYACIRREEARDRAFARTVQAEAQLGTAVEALRKIIEAYDDWSVNNYPDDGSSRHHAQAWFNEAERVELAIEEARPLSELEGGEDS